MRIVFIVIFSLILSACSSPQDLVFKAYKKGEIETIQACKTFVSDRVDTFIREVEVIKGDTIYLPSDTIIVDCDGIKGQVQVPCKPNFIVKDSIIYRDKEILVNDSDIKLANHERDSVLSENLKLQVLVGTLENKVEELKQANTKKAFIIGGLIALIGIATFLRIKRII